MDGDLSDWPEDMRGYPIRLPERGVRPKPKDAEDFEGRFRIGYNAGEDALYVGVEVRDESTVIDTMGGASWDTQDGCEVHVDVAHKEKDSPVVQYAIRGDRGDLRGVVSREGEDHRYEWRLNIGKMSGGKVQLHSGMVLGFDVVVCDKDEDGSFSQIAWGRGGDKSRSTDLRGDVVLVGGDVGIGRIQGRVRWEGREKGVAYAKVRVRSLEPEGLWVQTAPRGPRGRSTRPPCRCSDAAHCQRPPTSPGGWLPGKPSYTYRMYDSTAGTYHHYGL